jgi:hypothetical protein
VNWGVELIAAASVMVAGCHAVPPKPCATGRADDARRARILAVLDRALGRLEHEPAASRLRDVRERVQSVPVCFADEAALHADGTVVLEAKADDAAAAARAAHLMHHLLVEPPWDEGLRIACPERVAHALAVEQRGWALELAMRELLGVPTLLYAWEGDYRHAQPADRPQIVRAALESGEPPLMRDYTARCSQ